MSRIDRRALANGRKVWAALTAAPQATQEQIGSDLHLAKSTVHAAMRRLRQWGYIDYQPGVGGARTRTIIVPFGAVRKG